MTAEFLIPITFFAMIFGVFYLYLTTRNKERMAMIEKGADASIFTSGRSFSFGTTVLNLALLAIGIGVGVLIGSAFEMAGMDPDVSYPASIFIFAGLGLVVSFFINRKLAERDGFIK